MAWTEFVAAYAVFFLSHAVPVRPPVRPWLDARLGRRGFTLAYSALSLVVLGWLIGAAGRAPYLPLWNWAPWQAHVPLAVMVPVCLILGLSIARPNPFSFGGARNDRFDATRPGIVRWFRHPLLVALALWAGAHIVPNGDLAHVMLFGTFAGFALLGQSLIDHRKQREMRDSWTTLQISTSAARRPTAADIARDTPARIVIGVILYGALIVMHPLMFGVSPLP